jgi:hypothetical protein
VPKIWSLAYVVCNFVGVVSFNHMLFQLLLMNQSLGAEGLFIVIGSSVNQDGGLSHIYSTPNAMGFFEDRLRCKESAVVGQLRSHV